MTGRPALRGKHLLLAVAAVITAAGYTQSHTLAGELRTAAAEHTEHASTIAELHRAGTLPATPAVETTHTDLASLAAQVDQVTVISIDSEAGANVRHTLTVKTTPAGAVHLASAINDSGSYVTHRVSLTGDTAVLDLSPKETLR